jgi:uncharacterized membrane protein YdjX (TVP38/TMEM64 family)
VSATTLPPAARFGVIVGLLAGDILLPVPSSAVTTWGGGVLGVGWATLASTLGMSAGAALGFALARTLGGRFVTGRSAGGDLDRSAELVRRFGPVALVLTRPLPILAEACVLLVGTTGLPWRRFAVPVVLSNLVISGTYAAAGAYFRERGAFSPAIVLSGTIPLLAALLARRWLPGAGAGDENRVSSRGRSSVSEPSKSSAGTGD